MGEAWDRFVDGLQEAWASVGSALGEWVPRIIVAVLVLIVGRMVLRWLRGLIEKMLDSAGAQAVFDRAGVTAALAPSGRKPGALIATVGFAFLGLLLWLIIFRILQIAPIVDLLERLIAVLPLIFVAIALVIVAAAVANFVADLVDPYAKDRNVAWLTTAVRVLIILFGALAALNILDITFAEDIVKIATAAIGIAFAVAFGIGGIDTARQWWQRYAAPRT